MSVAAATGKLGHTALEKKGTAGAMSNVAAHMLPCALANGSTFFAAFA